METRHVHLTLRRLGVWSTAKFGCFFGMVIYSLIGLVVFAAMSPAFTMMLFNARTAQSLPSMVPACGAALMVAILGGGFVGFIHWGIMAILLNIAAALAGGIKMEFERHVRAAPSAPAKSRYDTDDRHSLEQQLVASGQYIRDLSRDVAKQKRQRFGD